MQITREFRIELLEQVKPVQLYLYGSPTSGGALLNIAEKYQLVSSFNYKKFALTVGDIVLGLYKIEDTVPLLQQELALDGKTATLLGADILDFLAPLSDPNWQPPIDEEENDILNNDVDFAEPDDVLPLSSPLESTNTELNNEPQVIPKIRTMANDMAQGRSPVRTTFNAASDIEETVYVSSQPTLEKKVIDVPSYAIPTLQTPIEDSRWN